LGHDSGKLARRYSGPAPQKQLPTRLREEPGHEEWLKALLNAASEGPLIISPIAFAELAPSTTDEASLTAFLGALSSPGERRAGVNAKD
jgi:hypothetical protein